jgi:hypothetical protein
MSNDSHQQETVILLRGAALAILAALVLAWCMVGLKLEAPPLLAAFPGKFTRILQAHIDLLLMSALILGFYASRAPLPWPVQWAMAIGAFTNSSLFLMMAMFPILESPAPEGPIAAFFRIFQPASCLLTTFGFGGAAIIALRDSFRAAR